MVGYFLKELGAFVQKYLLGILMGSFETNSGWSFLKELTTYPLDNDWVNCFKTHNKLTMYPLGK